MIQYIKLHFSVISHLHKQTVNMCFLYHNGGKGIEPCVAVWWSTDVNHPLLQLLLPQPLVAQLVASLNEIQATPASHQFLPKRQCNGENIQ